MSKSETAAEETRGKLEEAREQLKTNENGELAKRKALIVSVVYGGGDFLIGLGGKNDKVCLYLLFLPILQ